MAWHGVAWRGVAWLHAEFLSRNWLQPWAFGNRKSTPSTAETVPTNMLYVAMVGCLSQIVFK